MKKFIDIKLIWVEIIVTLVTLCFFFGLIALINRYAEGAIMFKEIGLMVIGFLLFGLGSFVMTLPSSKLNFKNVITQGNKAILNSAFGSSIFFASLAVWISFIVTALVHIDIYFPILLSFIIAVTICAYFTVKEARLPLSRYLHLRPINRKTVQISLAIEMTVIAIPIVIHLV